MELFDVLGVRLDTGVVRFMGKSKTEANAEAIVTMAVMRRGVEEEFFVTVPEGSYREGDIWEGPR